MGLVKYSAENLKCCKTVVKHIARKCNKIKDLPYLQALHVYTLKVTNFQMLSGDPPKLQLISRLPGFPPRENGNFEDRLCDIISLLRSLLSPNSVFSMLCHPTSPGFFQPRASNLLILSQTIGLLRWVLVNPVILIQWIRTQLWPFWAVFPFASALYYRKVGSLFQNWNNFITNMVPRF